MKLPQCVGVIGGRPHSSYYFVGIQDDTLFYLDPHYNQEYVALLDPRDATVDISSYSCNQRNTANLFEIDESLAVGFYLRSEKDFEQFVKVMDTVGENNEKLFWFEDKPSTQDTNISVSSGDDFSMDDF